MVKICKKNLYKYKAFSYKSKYQGKTYVTYKY